MIEMQIHNVSRRSSKGIFVALIIAFVLTVAVVQTGAALELNWADGIWQNAAGTPTCLMYDNTGPTYDENKVAYGSLYSSLVCPPNLDVTIQSGFGFDGCQHETITSGVAFDLGDFTHYNNPIYASNLLTTVELSVTLSFYIDASHTDVRKTLNYTFELDETPNSGSCTYPGDTVCPDKVWVLNTIPDETFWIGGTEYTLHIVGFVHQGQVIPVNELITEEEQRNDAVLVAELLAVWPAIEIEKATNGIDADDPPGPYIPMGDPVIWTYNVTNVGPVNLTGVGVIDDQGVTVTCPKTTLLIGENMTCTANGTATAGQYANIGNASGVGGGSSVFDTDPSHYFGCYPDLNITKVANVSSATVGTVIGYNITVNNTGNVNLTSVLVTDSLTGLNHTIPTLVPNASQTFNPTYTVTQADTGAPINNTATATGTDPCGGTVNDSDQCSVNVVIGPDIEVVKTASLTGTCPGSDPLAVNISDTVTYCFNVTNTGDVNLTSITVIDNIYGPVPLAKNDTLAPGESTEGTLTHVVVVSDAPSVTNTANATGTDPLGGNVTDTDSCTINVTIHPDVELEKTGSPSTVAPGGDVTYTINYTNTGAVPLHDVVITEHYPKGVTFISASPAPDAGTNNVWTIGTLLPGESGTIVIKVKVPEQIDLSFTETGSVIGEGVVMVTKDLSTEQKPYSLRNSVTLSCAELAPESAYATTKVSGVPGTSLGITESGSGLYSSDECLDLETKSKNIILEKSTYAEYKPTSFNFSDSFSVNFTNKWKQDICSRNMEIDAAIHKKISDATYIDDETISRVDKDKSVMNFDSSFNGSLYIGARTNDTAISETYIGEFDVLQTIHIGKGPIPTPAPTPTPTPIWLPCPFNASPEMNMTEDAEPTP